VVATFALHGSAKAGKAKNEAKRLASANFCIALITIHDGSKHLEALETNKVKERQKKLMGEYQRVANLWARSRAAFKRDPDTRGEKFTEPAPLRPQLRKLTRKSIKGKKAADEQLEVLKEKWLKPLLAKEEAARKVKEEAARKAREKADAKAGARAGGGAGAKPGRPAGGGGGRSGRGKGGGHRPSGNMARNGGFEEGKSDGGLTKSWVAGQWGAPGKRYSVRVCKTDSHGGDYSIAIKAYAQGAKPGAFTTMNVPEGKYEVSYWACTDVGKVATVCASLAGKPLRECHASEDWKQFKQKVSVPRDSQNASMKIWIDTASVRVFIDDVEVKAVE
jgi:hypothetical protein